MTGRFATFLSTNNMQSIDQSLTYSEFMKDTYQLTVEQMKHDSQFFYYNNFIIRNKLNVPAFSLSRSLGIQDIFWQRSCD